jgi:SNF2 family DNA or RNA helicase
VTGAENDRERDIRIREFQAGDTDCFVGTIAVGGVGIDLTRARITIFADLDWTPANVAQAEARVFRTNQTRPCITYWPIFNNTIEDRIIEVLLAKADHARTDIFPDGTVRPKPADIESGMISLLSNALEEEYF